MKNLFCKRLAACLCMKQSLSSVEPRPMKTLSVDIASHSQDHSDQHDDDFTPPTTENEWMKKLLKAIHDLLETLAHKEEEQRYEADKEKKNDWMLAAAVLDRICAVVLTVLFVVGTIAFFLVFAVHA